ncbi:dicarboxylate/amino acid:cation symporter [Anaeromyxobacter sp. Fw109-5]|uniref:dicarboxylate/amino acid:cation symporter n=1 Tax=Anaeromyxobacter sp. (strain Fw109-5) TaxID=404589 RepID=UPI0000ED7E8A|nr:dicarboxylate/amino acid:cation symporter [Anaeromyxobacter sp. Fw109-5]ABS26990.1 sodium:dicarboxylate symporter [Anaeromyxobacter sp. Fw109-5]
MPSHRKMLVAVLAGASLGIAANALGTGSPWLDVAVKDVAQPLGQLFIRLLFMLVVPLLFSALVLGVSDLDLRQLGRLGARMFGYTAAVSAIAVLIGVTLVNVLGPGRGMPDAVREIARVAAPVKPASTPGGDTVATFVVGLVPDNPVKAAATGDLIGLIVFSLLFGIALALTDTAPARRLRETIQGLYDVTMKLIEGVLKLAPLGVGALLFVMTARLGVAVIRPVAAYVGVVVLGLALHTLVVYSLSVRFLGGMSPRAFFAGSRLAMVTAFSTASSSATLPTALRVAEESLRLPRHVARFVLTAGSAMNQNGSALFEGVTVLFLAQVYGVELSLGQQAIAVGIAVLAGIGTAGIPAASLPFIAMILGIVGVPVEGIGLILGVDRFLDMCRTTVNVTGDLAAAVFVARGEDALATAEAGPPPDQAA